MLKDKPREMVRSILPSSARKFARESRAGEHRHHRRRVREALHSYGLAYENPDVESELTMRLHRSEMERRHGLREMVRTRRDRDKISSFVRWCEAHTKDVPKTDPLGRYCAAAALIGGDRDVIRSHALGHFVPKWKFNPNVQRF